MTYLFVHQRNEPAEINFPIVVHLHFSHDGIHLQWETNKPDIIPPPLKVTTKALRGKTTSVSVGLYPRVLNSWGISLEPRRPVLFWGVSKCTTLFSASNNNFFNFTLSKSLKASFISEMKSSGISCKILSVFSQHTALTRTYIPEALLQTMVLTVFHFVQVRKS